MQGRSSWPIVLIELLIFGVSGGMLWQIGWNYDGISGSPFTKIHPSTYLTVAIFVWNAVTSGNPVGYAVRSARLWPGAFFLLVAMLVLFAYIVSHDGAGMAGALDTYLAPALLVVLVGDLDRRGKSRIEITLHVLMTLNAALALVEFVSHTKFFPYRFEGALFPYDVRSTALQGHPLVNAATTAWYTLALLNGTRILPQGLRLSLVALQFAALITFGGRAATVVCGVLASLYVARRAHAALRSGRVPILTAAVALMITALLPILIIALAAGGFFDTLAERFVSDGGSANARVEMFSMFDNLSFHDILAGPDLGFINSLRRINGLEWGIENPIVKTLLYQGLIVTVFMTLAVAAFIYELSRQCVRGVWMPILCLLILINAAESIGGKTTMLAKFVLVLVCLYRPVELSPRAVRIGSSKLRVTSSITPIPSNKFQKAQENPNDSAVSRTSRI